MWPSYTKSTTSKKYAKSLAYITIVLCAEVFWILCLHTTLHHSKAENATFSPPFSLKSSKTDLPRQIETWKKWMPQNKKYQESMKVDVRKACNIIKPNILIQPMVTCLNKRKHLHLLRKLSNEAQNCILHKRHTFTQQETIAFGNRGDAFVFSSLSLCMSFILSAETNYCLPCLVVHAEEMQLIFNSRSWKKQEATIRTASVHWWRNSNY